MAAVAAGILKRTATIASRSLHASSSWRAYGPVAWRTDLVPAAPNLSCATTTSGSISRKYLDCWAASEGSTIARVVSHGREPRSCTPQLAFMVPTFWGRFMTTMGSPLESGSNEASTLTSNAPPRLKFKRLDKTARHIMQILDKESVEQVKAQREIPDIRPGYIVQLKVEVPENKRRVSIVKGIVIARRNAGLNSTFRLRRLVAGVGVESLFPLYSPNLKEIKVLDRKKVRRAKLYYLRDKMNALKKQ